MATSCTHKWANPAGFRMMVLYSIFLAAVVWPVIFSACPFAHVTRAMSYLFNSNNQWLRSWKSMFSLSTVFVPCERELLGCDQPVATLHLSPEKAAAATLSSSTPTFTSFIVLLIRPQLHAHAEARLRALGPWALSLDKEFTLACNSCIWVNNCLTERGLLCCIMVNSSIFTCCALSLSSHEWFRNSAISWQYIVLLSWKSSFLLSNSPHKVILCLRALSARTFAW